MSNGTMIAVGIVGAIVLVGGAIVILGMIERDRAAARRAQGPDFSAIFGGIVGLFQGASESEPQTRAGSGEVRYQLPGAKDYPSAAKV